MMVLITSACGKGSDEPACKHDLARAFASRINKVCKLKKTPNNLSPGCVAQSVTCLTTDAWLTADLGVVSLIPVRSHTFVEIDHEMMISTVILLPSADSFKKGCFQLQAKVCARITD